MSAKQLLKICCGIFVVALLFMGVDVDPLRIFLWDESQTYHFSVIFENIFQCISYKWHWYDASDLNAAEIYRRNLENAFWKVALRYRSVALEILCRINASVWMSREFLVNIVIHRSSSTRTSRICSFSGFILPTV